MKNIDTFTNLVRPYASKVDKNKIKSKAKYIPTLLDYGPIKAVNRLTNTAKLRK